QFNNLYFADQNSGWMTSSGRIYHSTNGGINWNVQGGINSSDLNALFFINNLTGWAGGYNGAILKTTNGGILVGLSNISTSIPKSYSLHQNYPNPFNPVTKIRFEIPSLNHHLQAGDREVVLLKIYDLLGREITTLVNEQLIPGIYEVDWDGSGFASGVYFYSLITENFVETKRMVLLK
ncbi:MAG: exopolysaccharide biosynthesis protein, partial [Chlorobi bacterium OLB5]